MIGLYFYYKKQHLARQTANVDNFVVILMFSRTSE